MLKTVRQLWADSVIPGLSELIRIPAVSPGFDADWAANGHLDAAIGHLRTWFGGRGIPDASAEVVTLPGRSPVLLIDVPASPGAEQAGTALLYGHLDKQPPMDGWSEGLDPWTPVLRDGHLYGRGSVDDGYAGFAAVTAIEALLANGGGHARCVVLLETGEESGSPDLPAYLESLRERLGRVSLVVCLDSGAEDYDRMWLTTSLRGLVQIEVTARVLESGQHSGAASGLVPSSFRVLRQLFDRLEDADSGEVLLPAMSVEIPADRIAEAKAAAEVGSGAVEAMLPLVPGVRLVTDDEVELRLNGSWRPTLSVIGAAGLPAPVDAGNVLRPYTTLCLSFRLPPTADSSAALAAVRRALTTDVPYGARVELARVEHADGWNAPGLAPWLRDALDSVSSEVFGAGWRTMGMGGSIPFMGLLHEKYPDAQFVVTGALGPDGNAHVPDESLHVEYAEKVTAGIGYVLAAHAGTA